MSSDLTLVWISNHHLYHVIARHSLVSAQKIKTELAHLAQSDDILDDESISRTGRPNPADNSVVVQRSLEMLERQDQCLAEAVVFAALAVEAFINYYAVKKSSLSYFKKYLDGLNPRQKWLLIPATFNPGKGLNPEREPFKSLIALVEARNSLVHAKPKRAVHVDGKGDFQTVPLADGRYHGPSLDKAEKCVDSVRRLVMALRAIDPAVQVDWLDEDRPDRLYFNLPGST